MFQASRRKWIRVYWFLALCLAGIALLYPINALASIELLSFDISQESNWIRLDWETATEIDNAGFRIQRSTIGGSNPNDYASILVYDIFENETTNFIEAEGDLIGATYAVYDQNVTANTTYYYLLEAIDNQSNSEFHGPITWTLTANVTPTLTLTPTPTRTNTPSPTVSVSESLTPTITLTPTSTPTRTPSRTPTRTSTSPPTFPPLNTVTPTRTQTPTPGPSPTITQSPTVTPSPTVTLHPLDLTLTAVLAQVTPLPTYTPFPPTRTPFPTWTPEAPITSTPPAPGILEGASAASLRGILLIGFLVFGGGGMLTFLLLFSRKKDDSPH